MAIQSFFTFGSHAVPGDNNLSFPYIYEDTSVLGFSKSFNTIEGSPINVWIPYLLILNSTVDTILLQSKNTVYVDQTHVKKVNGSTGVQSLVELNTSNVTQADCVIKFSWGDSEMTSALENVRFFAYDITSGLLLNPPPNLTIVAFEHAGNSIRKDRVNGPNKAWDEQYGIGGQANALSLATQPSANFHDFYIGVSIKPTAYGNTSFGLCIQFDIG